MVYGTNITPAGLASWTDNEILRAITAGVNRDGDVLFPVMPYRNYRYLTQGDAAAIITYVRTLSPIEHPVPPRRLNFFWSSSFGRLPSTECVWPPRSMKETPKGHLIRSSTVNT